MSDLSQLQDVQIPASFDEYDDDHLLAILPTDVAKAVANLLQTRRQLRLIETENLRDVISTELDKLYTACLKEWRDL